VNLKNTRDELPIFPEGLPIIQGTGDLPTLKLSPDKITISAEHVFEANEVRSLSNIAQICRWIFNYPERKFYLFLIEGIKENRDLIYHIEKSGILAPTTERHFYKHPSKYPKDFIRIHPNEIEFDWEREVVKKGPKYIRLELILSEHKRRELEIKEKIDTERGADTNPLELKPNIMGFGIDINKALKWLKNIFKSKKIGNYKK
jgi:hypothetical protein